MTLSLISVCSLGAMQVVSLMEEIESQFILYFSHNIYNNSVPTGDVFLVASRLQ